MKKIHFLLILLLLTSCKKIVKESIKDLTKNSVKKEAKKIVKKEVKNEFKENLAKKSIKSKSKNILNGAIEKQIVSLGFITKKTKNSVHIFSKDKKKLATLSGNTLTAKPGYNRADMNPILNQRKLLPNFTYKVEDCIYKTDELGRVISLNKATFPRSVVKKPRLSDYQSKGNYQKNGIVNSDHGGHLVANQLGGASEIINIIPQNKFLNTKKRYGWKEMEDFISNNREFVKNYNIKLTYVNKSMRPNKIIASYEYKGKKVTKVFDNEIVSSLTTIK